MGCGDVDSAEMLWFIGEKQAKIGLKKCKFQQGFLTYLCDGQTPCCILYWSGTVVCYDSWRLNIN